MVSDNGKHDETCMRRREDPNMHMVCSCGITDDQVRDAFGIAKPLASPAMRTQGDVEKASARQNKADNQRQREMAASELEKNRLRAVEMRDAREKRQAAAHEKLVSAASYEDPVSRFRKLMGTELPPQTGPLREAEPGMNITNQERYPG